MLNLKNVSKFYYDKGIIATGFTKINLELKIGEFVVITGESGSGKSTLLNVISGLDSYEEGEMYINGEETSHYTEKEFEEYRRRYIANIFQSFNLVNSYTVYQNVELILLLNGYKKKEIKKKVLDIIDQVGLTKFKNTKVSKLSGGQKQRVAIARAMVKDTPIIVADEPTGNLDTTSAKDVIEILKKVAKDKLVIVVTHNIEQVEEYATRIIKMHDGRIIENKEVKKIDENVQVKESEYKKITMFSKYRLGIRNTFNIITKFLLLFAVFFFITAALLSEYASFKLSEYEASKDGYNINFRDLSDNRIIINKINKEPFSSEDYEKIKSFSNVDYILEDDLFADRGLNFYKDDLSFYCYLKDITNFKYNVDIGRMPEAKDEVIVQSSKNQYYLNNRVDEVLNKEFTITDYNGMLEENKVRIVGIKYNNEDDNYDVNMYISQDYFKELRIAVNKSYSKVKILLNNKYTESNEYVQYYKVLPSDRVAIGGAIVSEDLNYEFSDGRARNKPLSIYVNNIYYNEELNLKIVNTYSKSNFKRLTGYDKFDNYRGAIFINKDEYNSLYNKPSYQSSVYVKDIDLIDETLEELKGLGINAKKITDFRVDEGAIYKQIINIIKVIVTIILIVVLFFISYFIVKIILKSRNVYYTTLRMLGATHKSVKRILDIELFVNSSLAYGVVIALITLINNGIIQNDYILKLSHYLSIREYVLMYLILVLMARLISRRFSKKIFKDTAINTYKEEV